jgi:hypothetical protein
MTCGAAWAECTVDAIEYGPIGGNVGRSYRLKNLILAVLWDRSSRGARFASCSELNLLRVPN